MPEQEERRQFKRFRPKDGTMAVNSHALGPVINISMGGLSFQYMATSTVTPTLDILGIFLGSDDLLIDKIPTRLITDEIISQGSMFLQTSTRRCSLQFTELTNSQRSNLEDFINTKTIGLHSPPSHSTSSFPSTP